MPKAHLRPSVLLTGLAAAAPLTAPAATPLSQEVNDSYSQAYKLYVDLHQHPELSGNEIQTASKVAAALKAQGYTVTEHVGGTGVVAILKNGAGPTIMLRCRSRKRRVSLTRARSARRIPTGATSPSDTCAATTFT
jgi:hypothetical protein